MSSLRHGTLLKVSNTKLGEISQNVHYEACPFEAKDSGWLVKTMIVPNCC